MAIKSDAAWRAEEMSERDLDLLRRPFGDDRWHHELCIEEKDTLSDLCDTLCVTKRDESIMVVSDNAAFMKGGPWYRITEWGMKVIKEAANDPT